MTQFLYLPVQKTIMPVTVTAGRAAASTLPAVASSIEAKTARHKAMSASLIQREPEDMIMGSKREHATTRKKSRVPRRQMSLVPTTCVRLQNAVGCGFLRVGVTMRGDLR